MRKKLLKPELVKEAPSVCTKPGCGGTVFIPHQDGWQCLNCMKIIYAADGYRQRDIYKTLWFY
jgi:ribosomal protein S27AE